MILNRIWLLREKGSGQEQATEEKGILASSGSIESVEDLATEEKVFWSVAWLLRTVGLWSLAGYRLLRKIVLASS